MRKAFSFSRRAVEEMTYKRYKEEEQGVHLLDPNAKMIPLFDRLDQGVGYPKDFYFLQTEQFLKHYDFLAARIEAPQLGPEALQQKYIDQIC